MPVTVQFNASDLPGSNGQNALVCVLASDGYHTVIATSQPFTVLHRGPEPYIVTPHIGASVAVDQPLALTGGASDAEDGTVDPAGLTWRIDGNVAGTGTQQIVTGLAPGEHTVQRPGGISSAPVRFLVVAPTPTINRVGPERVLAGADTTNVMISGIGFLNGATVLWNDKPLATTFGNGGQLNAQVESTRLAVGGVAGIAVQNPGVDRTMSNSVPYFRIGFKAFRHNPVNRSTAEVSVSAAPLNLYSEILCVHFTGRPNGRKHKRISEQVFNNLHLQLMGGIPAVP